MEAIDETPGRRGDAIAVDQVGYRPERQKRAVVLIDGRSFASPTVEAPTAAEPDTDLPTATTFTVVDAETNAVAYRGELSPPVDAATADRTVRHADFSEVTAPGTYEVRLENGTARSHPFRIGADVYDDVLRDVGRLYSLKRSGVAIEDPITGLDVAPGHPQDANAALYFDDPFHDAGETVDVSGGWYDAGDYGKYVPPAAIAVGHHLLAYELSPAAFTDGQYDLPESLDDGASGLPDLLAEVRFECEWLERMQRPDGAVYHKVSGAEWTPWGPTPAEDDADRYVFGLSTYGTAMFAGAMAMAARVLEPFDPAFAERALENAETAFEYLEEHPEPEFRFDEGQDGGSGPYDKHEDAEERFWAGAELLRTTGDARYAEYLDSQLAAQFDEPVVPPIWNNGRAMGQWAYLHADDAVVDPDRVETLAAAFVDAGEELLERIDADGYRISLRREDYHWSSNKVAATNGVLLLLANEIDPRERFQEAALDQLHYVLGRSPTGYSYVTGHGERPVRQPHDRLVAATGTPIPGMLAGGPNRDGDDRVMDAFLAANDVPPALAYLDAPRAYSVNEWAIDYSAPLVGLLGYAVAGE